MPASLDAWYSLYDLQALGQRKACLAGEIELKQLERLRELLDTDRGSVRASLGFRQQATGHVTVDMEFETTLALVCQRCLESLTHRVQEHVSLVVLQPDATEASAPEGYEPVALSAGRLQPAALIEDELIVALPLIPRHARIAECGKLAQDIEAALVGSGLSNPPLRSH